MKKIWLFLLLAALPLLAQEAEPIVLLQGITIVESGKDLEDIPRKSGLRFEVPGISVRGLRSYLGKFLERPINQTLVQEVKNAILDFLNVQDVFALVIVPEQEVINGVIIAEVLFAEIEDIRFTGQKWFPERMLEKAITLKVGDKLDQNRLLNDLASLNSNRKHRTDVYFSPGSKPGMTNVEFLTKDQLPFSAFVGGDSTGVRTTDRIRFFAGASWDNAFFRDDNLLYQYSCSPNFHNFQSHMAVYTCRLHPKNTLTVFGNYGQVFSSIEPFNSEGKSAQGVILYRRTIEPGYRSFKHEWEIGGYYRYLNSNLAFVGSFGEFPLIQQSVNLTELELGYFMTNFWGPHQAALELRFFLSPFNGFFPNQTTSDYNVLRPFSSPQFAYANGKFSYRYRLWDTWSFLMRITGQGASGPLLSSEQVSLGGMNSVRGYEQSQYLVDNALLANFEWSLPYFNIYKKIKDRAVFMLFLDAAWGMNYRMNGTDFASQWLAGTGPSFRYEIPSRFSFCAEYGFKLQKIATWDATGRFYLKATVTY